MPFIKVATISEIPEGHGRTFSERGQKVAVFKKDGKFYAIDNTCPHQGGSLGEGFLDDKTVICPLHAWKFNIETGKSPQLPMIGVKVYNVKIEGSDVMVEFD